MGPLEGQLIQYFLIAVLDAAFLSWFVILWYRRRMLALMSTASLRGGEAVADHPAQGRPEAPESTAAPSSFRLELVNADTAEEPAVDVGRNFSSAEAEANAATTPTASRERRVRPRIVAAYATGAALYSAIITGVTFGPDAAALPLAGWFAQWWIFMWPIVPTLALLLALDRRASLKLAAAYLGIGCLAVVLITIVGQMLRGSFNSAPVTNVYWMLVSLAWAATAPLCLILVTGWRPIRGVMPMVMAATLLFGAAMMVFWRIFVRALNMEAVQSAVLTISPGSFMLLGAYLLFMLLSLPVGWAAWLTLRRLAARYERKRFSDLQMVVDSWWIIVAAEAAATMPVPTVPALAAGCIAFAVYKAGVRGVLAAWPLEADADAPRLLLLRVFGYQPRTEKLFDRVAAVWRFRGPVHLIAAPDLATRTVDPGDTLALIGGRLAEQYVGSAGEVPPRMAALDRRPDPDGRYRVNEVYCHDDTWRPSLEALLDASDGVLMDLRSFSRQNAGCIFELEQIVRHVPSGNVVLVVDRTTDVAFLQEVAEAAWATARADGGARGDGRMSAVVIDRRSREGLTRLWARLDRIRGTVKVRPEAAVAAAATT